MTVMFDARAWACKVGPTEAAVLRAMLEEEVVKRGMKYYLKGAARIIVASEEAMDTGDVSIRTILRIPQVDNGEEFEVGHEYRISNWSLHQRADQGSLFTDYLERMRGQLTPYVLLLNSNYEAYYAKAKLNVPEAPSEIVGSF